MEIVLAAGILHAPKLCWQLSVASHCSVCYSLIMPGRQELAQSVCRLQFSVLASSLGHVSYRRLMQHATATSCGLAIAMSSSRAAETEAGLMPTPFIKCLHGATITLSASAEEAVLARDNCRCTEKYISCC